MKGRLPNLPIASVLGHDTCYGCSSVIRVRPRAKSRRPGVCRLRNGLSIKLRWACLTSPLPLGFAVFGGSTTHSKRHMAVRRRRFPGLSSDLSPQIELNLFGAKRSNQAKGR
jgi:hypothetical protein